ncbi:MAG: hypothetical protein IPP01_01100 [Saprospiraceae bacterium]|nr:hypothetical protein [Saprospiraceae bacterium]
MTSLPTFSKCVLFIYLLFNFREIQAQEFKISKVIKSELSESVKDKDLLKKEFTSIIGVAYDSLGNNYMIKTDPRKADKLGETSLEIYSSKLSLLKSIKLKLPVESDTYYTILNYCTLDNKPTLFYYQYNKNSDKKILYFVQFGPDGELSRKGKMVEVNTKTEQQGLFGIIYSIRLTKFMVFVYPPMNNGDNFRANCFIFNDKLERINKFEIENDFTYEDSYNSDWMLTEDGVPLCFYEIKRRNHIKGYGSTMRFIKLYEEPKSPTTYNLDLLKKKITSLILSIDDNKDLTFVGNYVAQEKSLSQGGVFVKIGRQEKKVKVAKLYPYSADVLQFFKMKPKDVEGNKGIENQYPVWAGGSTSMNSFLVLGNSEREVGQGEDLSYSNSYIIYKFDPSGNVIFQKVHPNHCIASFSNEGIFPKSFVSGDELAILSNVNEDDIEKIKNGIKYGSKLTGCGTSIHGSGLGKNAYAAIYLTTYNSKGQAKYVRVNDPKNHPVFMSNCYTDIRVPKSITIGVLGKQKYGLMKIEF